VEKYLACTNNNMKDRCNKFKVDCGYMSSCYFIRPERCIESMEQRKTVIKRGAIEQKRELVELQTKINILNNAQANRWNK